MIDDSFETELMHEKWKKEFGRLESELDKFRDYYNRTKKCKCHIDECKHYDKAMSKVFAKRVDNLWNLRLQVGFRTLNSAYGVKR